MAFIDPAPHNFSVRISGTLGQTSALDKYPSHSDTRGLAGMRCVATVAARDAIPDLQRNPGMLVYTDDLRNIYQLEQDRITWTLFSGAASGSGDGWAILRFTDVTQVTAIDVLDYPNYQLWMDSTIVRFLHHSYNAYPLVEGHKGFGFAYNVLRDEPNQVDTTDQEHIAFYSELTKLMTVDFPIARTGVLSVNWQVK